MRQWATVQSITAGFLYSSPRRKRERSVSSAGPRRALPSGLGVGEKALSGNGLINKVCDKTLLFITYTKIGMPNT